LAVPHDLLIAFIDGAIAMGLFVAGLCFFRSWRRTEDRLFLIFCIAFWLLTLNRIFLASIGPARRASGEDFILAYVIRLLAFGLLLAAIIDKNRRSGRRKDDSGS
jgi:hypothetical protein